MDFLKASKIGQKQNKQTKNPTVLKKKVFYFTDSQTDVFCYL